MINRIKKKFRSQDNRRLFSNFAALTVLQGANYIFPLITLPYLVRVLGVEKYGLLAFAGATTGYFNIVVDYGFDLVAPREIAINRKNWAKISEIYSAVMIIKIILMVISTVLLTALVFSFDKFSTDWKLYYLTFGVVVGQALFPVWLFQGLEEMKYIAYLNLLTRLIFTVAIFIFVKNEADYYLVPVIRSLGAVLVGFMAICIVKRKFKVVFRLQPFRVLSHYFREGYHVFISKIAISLYTISTTFILGLFTNNVIVGYFAAADRIIQALKGLTGPISQAIYPFISKKISDSKEEGLRIIRLAAKYIGGITGVISLFVLIFAAPLVHILLGSQYENSVSVLRIMSVLPFFIGLSNVFGVQAMVSFGREKPFSRIVITGSILNLVLSFILVPLFHQVGSAISVVTVELFITLSMFIYLQTHGLKIIGVNRFV